MKIKKKKKKKKKKKTYITYTFEVNIIAVSAAESAINSIFFKVVTKDGHKAIFRSDLICKSIKDCIVCRSHKLFCNGKLLLAFPFVLSLK